MKKSKIFPIPRHLRKLGSVSIFLTLARFPGWSANIAIEVICESFSLLPILFFLG